MPHRSGQASIPVCYRPFLLVAEASAWATLAIALKPRHLFEMPILAKATMGDRSTGSKQTLNGLFLFTADHRIYLAKDKLHFRILSPELFFSSPWAES